MNKIKKFPKNDLDDIKKSILNFYENFKNKIKMYNVKTLSIKEFIKLNQSELKNYYKYNFCSFINTFIKIIFMTIEDIHDISKEKKINENIQKEKRYSTENILDKNINYKSIYSNFEIKQYLKPNKIDDFKRLSNFLKKDLLGKEILEKDKIDKKNLKIKFKWENLGETNKEIKELNEMDYFKIQKKYNDIKLLNHILTKKNKFWNNLLKDLKDGLDKNLFNLKEDNNILNKELNNQFNEINKLKEIIKQKDFLINENKKKDVEINILTLKLKNINKNFERQNLKKWNYKEHEIITLSKEVHMLKNIWDKKLRNEYKRFNLDLNHSSTYYNNKLKSFRLNNSSKKTLVYNYNNSELKTK